MGAIKEYYHEEIQQSQTEERERHAYAWGRKDYQTEVLAAIEVMQSALHERDAEGHVWLNKLRALINDVKP